VPLGMVATTAPVAGLTMFIDASVAALVLPLIQCPAMSGCVCLPACVSVMASTLRRVNAVSHVKNVPR